MTEKKYRLMKDLPGCKAGSIFKFFEGMKSYTHEDCLWIGQYPSFSTKSFDSYIGEWFTEIIETPPAETKEGFVWTDELVKEFACFAFKNTTSMADAQSDDAYIEQFKQSKQPSWGVLKSESDGKLTVPADIADELGSLPQCHTDTKERIEVTKIEDWGKTWKNSQQYLVIHTSGKIPEEKHKEIKKAIEAILNNEYVGRLYDGATMGRLFTQSEMDEAMMNAFHSARLTHPLAGMKFNTFNDFKNNLK